MSQFRGPLSYQGDNAGNGVSGFWSDLPDNIFDENIGTYDEIRPSQLAYLTDTTSAVIGSNIGTGKGFYAYAAATCADAGKKGGAFSIGDTTDNQGFTIFPQTGIVKIASTTYKLWFETQIETSTIADTKHNFFVGLYEPLVPTTGYPLSTSDALVDKNQIGFVRYADATAGNGSVVKFVYKKAGQTAQMLTSTGVAAIDATNITTAKVATLVAATSIKLGFKYIHTNSTKAITVYVNGVDFGSYVTNTNRDAATFPNDKFMGLQFGVMNATSSTPGTTTMYWAKVAQLFDNR